MFVWQDNRKIVLNKQRFKIYYQNTLIERVSQDIRHLTKNQEKEPSCEEAGAEGTTVSSATIYTKDIQQVTDFTDLQ